MNWQLNKQLVFYSVIVMNIGIKYNLKDSLSFANLQPLKNDQFVIPKSRYDSIDSYLSPCGELYNDNQLIYDKEIYDQLREAGL